MSVPSVRAQRPRNTPHVRLPRKETPRVPPPQPPTAYIIRIEPPTPATRPTVHLEPQGRPQDTRTFHDVDELLRHLWLLLEGGVR
ncbi:hypothetical protein SY84_15350 [Deinococcus soli (ex Cha et al. 2016)]|uniref:Uncharacterized protein n=1 Tax=Deinococcus soli (ex Cha et al. 2016) TaxID=1309411 RepID=A0A0F7JP31_9DEIO|nr:hypothetical protein SY84_15350 [Deinococcus soli (ex Cha et al. 2016)]GGB51498.1 hypothetical protein GCM10008019_03920 [Deinococcus soli (ex Cha et al. 2016)]